MSKRRNIGDIVRKKPNAGFIGESLIIKLVDLDTERPRTNMLYKSYCVLDCGDKKCEEWDNCQIVVDGTPIDDYCYHVSECQMEDL